MDHTINNISTNVGTTTLSTTNKAMPLRPRILQEGYEWTAIVQDITAYVGIFIILLGIIDNFLNIVVFRKQGLQDSVTLSLFTLSISDFLLCVLLFGTAVMGYIKAFDPGHVLDPDSILVSCFGYPRAITYFYSTCVTVYLSLERSLCVILPFKFKMIFTKKVTIAYLIFLVFFVVSWFVPVFATQGLMWRFDPRYNISRVFMWRKPDVRDIHLVFIITTSFVIPIASQTIIGISTGLMIYGLQASTRFRKQSSNATDKDSKNEGLQGKELKAVKMVLSLSIIFFVCNLPLIIIAIAQMILPEFQFNRYYSRLYETMYGLVYMISSINAALNFVVYYQNSTRFKSVCLGIFGMNGEDDKK